MNLDVSNLVSAICGGGVIILCESEYSCLTLFKRKTSLFFFVCQMSILSNALNIAFISITYFIHSLLKLPMFIIISITKFLIDSSYPIMILLRLKLVVKFPTIIMYIPLIIAFIFSGLRYFWILYILNDGKYYFNAYYIIQLITSIILCVENIIINVFFIIIAMKNFDEVVHVKGIIIINIIAIILEIIKVIIESLLLFDVLATAIVVSIMTQIRVRLEIIILANIKSAHRQARNENEHVGILPGISERQLMLTIEQLNSHNNVTISV